MFPGRKDERGTGLHICGARSRAGSSEAGVSVGMYLGLKLCCEAPLDNPIAQKLLKSREAGPARLGKLLVNNPRCKTSSYCIR